jgi:hypothetical protein
MEEPVKHAWEGTLAAIIAGVIATLTLVSHLTARPDPLTSAESGPGRMPGASALRPISPSSSRKAIRTAQSQPGSQKPSNPLEVVLGPSSIGGQFTLLAANRISSTPTSDKLTLRLRVASRAVGDFVTPLQYVLLEVYTPGLDPIASEHSFSNPLPAGTTRDEDVAFVVPSSFALDRSFLRIHFYNEQKDLPLSLLAIPASAAAAQIRGLEAHETRR